MRNSNYFVFCDNQIWNRGFLDGFSIEDGKLLSKDGSALFLSMALDSTKEDCEWDSVSLQYKESLEKELSFYAFATNHRFVEHNKEELAYDEIFASKTLSVEEKKQFFFKQTPIRFRNLKNAPLFSLRGRYLWFLLIVKSSKEESFCLEKLHISYQPDSFMRHLPAVYSRWDKDGFMRSFVTIFQTMMEDFDQTIVDFHKQFDLDYLDKEGLKRLATLRNFDASDVWEEENLRRFLRELNDIYSMKGTKWAIQRSISLFLGCEPILMEEDDSEKAMFRVILPFSKVKTKKHYDEILYLIDKLKPAFSKPILILQKESENNVSDFEDGIFLQDELELTDDIFHTELTL